MPSDESTRGPLGVGATHFIVDLDSWVLRRKAEWSDAALRLVRYSAIYRAVMMSALVVWSAGALTSQSGIGEALWRVPMMIVGVFYYFGWQLVVLVALYACLVRRSRIPVMIGLALALPYLALAYKADYLNMIVGAVLGPIAPLIWPQLIPVTPYVLLLAVMCWFFIVLQVGLFAGLVVHATKSNAVRSDLAAPTLMLAGRGWFGQILEIAHAPYLSSRSSTLAQLLFATSTIFYVQGVILPWMMLSALKDREHPCVPGEAPLDDKAFTCFATGTGNAEFFLYYVGSYLLASTAALMMANVLRDAARRAVYRSTATGVLTERTTLPLVLFLRSFRDDQVVLKGRRASLLTRWLEIGRRSRTLDGVIVDEFGWSAAVVAIGDPKNAVPRAVGALREQIADADWQSVVTEQMSRATAVILTLDDTDGVAWEFAEILRTNAVSKSLFVFHPQLGTPQRDHFARALGFEPSALGLHSNCVQALMVNGERQVTFVSRGNIGTVEAAIILRQFVAELRQSPRAMPGPQLSTPPPG